MTDLEMLQTAVGLAGTFVGSMILVLRKGLKNRVEILQRENDRDRQVEQVLFRILNAPGVMRAYLTKFHNGEYFLDGSSFRKKTRVMEVCADGVQPQAGEYQNLPTSLMPDEMTLVLAPGPGFSFVKDLPDGRFKWLCKIGNVTAVARVAIRRPVPSGETSIYGFVGIDFDSRCTGEPEWIAQLLEYAGRVEIYLKD